MERLSLENKLTIETLWQIKTTVKPTDIPANISKSNKSIDYNSDKK